MSVSTLHLYKVNKHVIDYSNVWAGTFETMSKTYLGKVILNYYVPLSDEFDITLNSELLRKTEPKNLFNINSTRYEKTNIAGDYVISHNKITMKQLTTGYYAVEYRVPVVAGNYRFQFSRLLISGINTISSGYVRLQKSTDGTIDNAYGDVLGYDSSFNFEVTEPCYLNIRLTNKNQTNLSLDISWQFYDIMLFEGSTQTDYVPYFSTTTLNAFNDVNYAVIENEDETRHYFIKDKKQRLAKGTRLFSLSVDDWFDKGLNNGLDVLQRVGHPDANFPVFGEAYDYIVKPSYYGSIKNQSTLYQFTTYTNACAIVIIYQTPTTFITVVRGYNGVVPSTVSADFKNLCLATKIKYTSGTVVDVTPIKGYIVPGAFFGTTDYTTGFNLDFYINGSYTGFDDFAKEPGSANIQSSFSSRTFYTSGKWDTTPFTDCINNGYPIREVFGVMGQTYNIDSPIVRTIGTTSLSMALNLSFGLSDITTTIKSDFTDNKFEDITSAFEEIVSYSEYQQFVNTNRSSLAVQRGINLFNVGAGVLSIATGQGGMGLVSAVSGIATTESSVQDKKYKKSITTGNQGGLINLANAYAYGLNGFCAHYETCRNSKNVLETIQKYGYKFDGLMTNTLNRTSTVFETYFSDTNIKASNDLQYNRYYRYIEGDLVSSKLMPEQILTAFKKGVYVHYAVATP